MLDVPINTFWKDAGYNRLASAFHPVGVYMSINKLFTMSSNKTVLIHFDSGFGAALADSFPCANTAIVALEW